MRVLVSDETLSKSLESPSRAMDRVKVVRIRNSTSGEVTQNLKRIHSKRMRRPTSTMPTLAMMITAWTMFWADVSNPTASTSWPR